MNPNINYIISATAITLILTTSDNNIVRRVISKDNNAYASIIEFLGADDLADKSADDLLAIIDKKSTPDLKGLVEDGDKYYYNGQLLPEALCKKIKSIKATGVSFAPFEAFIERIVQNPSATSIAELYDFLAYKELPITADGCFIAYKGIRSNGYSIKGNLNTTVLTGTVDEEGRIKNDNFGEKISVARNQVDDNRDKHCSFGLHVGSLDYAKGWSASVRRIIMVKVDPADVVSVPSDHSFQKCRVCAYTPMADLKIEVGPITAPTVESDLTPIVSEYDKVAEDRETFLDRVDYTLAELEFVCDKISISDLSLLVEGTELAVKEALTTLGVSWDDWNNTIYF